MKKKFQSNLSKLVEGRRRRGFLYESGLEFLSSYKNRVLHMGGNMEKNFDLMSVKIVRMYFRKSLLPLHNKRRNN